jgi:hypothetical protein
MGGLGCLDKNVILFCFLTKQFSMIKSFLLVTLGVF